MKKLFKIVSIFILIVILLFAGLFTYMYVNQDAIKQYALRQLNAQLKSEISASQIDITVFSIFPNVGLDLKDFRLSEPYHSEKNIIKASHLYLGFNIQNILSKNYKINMLSIDSGFCHLALDKKGKSNFDILLESKDTGKSEPFWFEMEQVKLNNIFFTFNNEHSKMHYRFNIENTTLSGKFIDKVFDLTCSANAFVQDITANKLAIVKDKKLSIETVLNINNQKKIYAIKQCDLAVEDLKLALSGDVSSSKNSTDINLKFKAKEISIASLLSIMPITLPEKVKQYKSMGDVYFSGSVKGQATDTKSPSIQVDFGINNGSLQADNNIDLKNISLKGWFNNGYAHNMTSSELVLDDIKANLGSGSLSGLFKLNNFESKNFTSNLKSQFEIDDFLKIFPIAAIKSARGEMKVDLQLSGSLSNTNSVLHNPANSGSLTLNLPSLRLKQADKEILNLKAELSLQQGDLLIKSCNAEIEQSDVKISGSIDNALAYMIDDKEQLNANINYVSEQKQVDDKKGAVDKGFSLPDRINLTLNANIKKLVYFGFTANNVISNIKMEGKKINFEQVSFGAMGGSIKLNGTVNNASNGDFFVSTSSNLSNIDIAEMFRQMNNFDQVNIIDKNLKGKLSGNVDFAGVWKSDLSCLMDKIYMYSNVKINNGELVNYKPLEALSKYISLDDLRNIKFASLSNVIEIKNKNIFVSQMEIKNNALNVSLSGKQNFDNVLDYKLKLSLSELIKKKRKPKENEFGEEDEKTGGLNLFVSISGPINNLKFSYDKIGVKNKIKQDIKIEKENIKEIFKKELGLDKPNQLKQKEKKKDDEELEFENN
ncbi:MAG: hypothetical protein EBZ58_06895 [Bacteroidetes bacterium]|nr:hypothetical protein [Bacteroidota bacterium]